MYSRKHSALGSRILGIKRNDDVILPLVTNMASRVQKKLFRGENSKKKNRVGANNNKYITQKIQAFAHGLSRLKENGKLFDHQLFRKMLKRNGLSTGKLTAIILEME